ncbi:hypothetical protein [Methylobacterium sp. Leaf117]|uniref:hypothetical protein n=1 Tax=Methylobacterium sp. Leaf117 TaxID=1736260 RepID=UPI0006FD54D7|nr:hypothetical protein [Methylobacterium sp. Leaf117]KQP83073.1 hypothetical protein ASF57_13300 [Methylobacterium sp. Leaf117]
MAPPHHADVRNRLLHRLSGHDFALLQPHLRLMPTELRQTLIAPHEPVAQVFFPEVGYTSVLADVAGNRIAVGIIGREGLVSASPVLLDSGRTPSSPSATVLAPTDGRSIPRATHCRISTRRETMP